MRVKKNPSNGSADKAVKAIRRHVSAEEQDPDCSGRLTDLPAKTGPVRELV